MPLLEVAQAALALPPSHPLVRFVRTLPGPRGWIERLEAKRLFSDLVGRPHLGGLLVGEAERIIGHRLGRGPRTLRRWRTGK